MSLHPRSSLMSSWSLALLLAAVGPAMAAAPLPPATQPHVHYMVVVTGGELLSGAIADGHTQFLARTLRPLGLECVGSMTVDDRLPDIKQAIAFARGNAPLVIVTGGLGPTDNDVTRQALTEATGIALREHPQAIADMEKRFKTPRDQLRANLRRQTHVPQRGTYLKNANGTAVGLVFEMDDAVVVALPGPPRELQPMVRDELVPYLSKRFGTSLPGPSLTIRFIGLGQSQISQTLNERVAVPADVILCSQFEGGRVDFTFSLPYDTPANRGRLEELKKRIHQQLDDNIYADDQTTLEQHVLTLLAQRRATLALVEAGSAGGLAAALAGAESDRGVLTGAYVAPTEERLRKLLQVNDKPWAEARSSVEKAKLLAEAAAKLSNADWVVVVGEAQRDQGGENVAEVVFRMPQGRVETRRINIRGTGELARAGITTQLLDEMRLRLR